MTSVPCFTIGMAMACLYTAPEHKQFHNCLNGRLSNFQVVLSYSPNLPNVAPLISTTEGLSKLSVLVSLGPQRIAEIRFTKSLWESANNTCLINNLFNISENLDYEDPVRV
jgi:hypothetical protein